MTTDPYQIDGPEPMPEGCCLIEGLRLNLTARAIKAPFRVAQRKQGSHNDKTVGLIIREVDRKRMVAALDAKEGRKR